GFNAHKPSVFNRVRFLKAYEVRRMKPDAVILGSSRSHLAFRPGHEAWARQNERTYNLAFDGALTKEMYFYLRHAHAVRPLKRVLLCLDTYHPTRAPANARPDFDPGLLLSNSGFLSRTKLLLADLKVLVSFDTLKNSVQTVRSQNTTEDSWLAPDGQRLCEVFFRRPGENFVKDGP